MKRICLVLAALLSLAACASAATEPVFEPWQKGLYNYCPSIFEEDGERHIYYCTNTVAGIVQDSIGYRRAMAGEAFGQETVVLRRGNVWPAWDIVHVCDPDVVKGRFELDGEVYSYLMAYLGCDTTDDQENEIGLAVAKSPEGPFVKVEALNPFIPYEENPLLSSWQGLFRWGVGWPSLISLDHQGQVMLIYTRGDGLKTGLICEKWDLSDLSHPRQLGERIRILENGVVGRDGNQAHLANADFIYDPADGALYMVCDGFPYLVPGDTYGQPDYVASALWVMRYSQQLPPEEMAAFFTDQEDAYWTCIATIGRDETGYPRNHNAGLLGDAYGWKLPGDTLHVYHAVTSVNVYTYRIHDWIVKLPE